MSNTVAISINKGDASAVLAALYNAETACLERALMLQNRGRPLRASEARSMARVLGNLHARLSVAACKT